jgi:enediyne biosynthesis protein E7
MAFNGAMLDRLPLAYAVDTRCIYATGFSNGASLTSRLALRSRTASQRSPPNSGALNLDDEPAARPLTLDAGYTRRQHAHLGVRARERPRRGVQPDGGRGRRALGQLPHAVAEGPKRAMLTPMRSMASAMSLDPARARAEVDAPKLSGRFQERSARGLRELYYFQRNIAHYAEASLEIMRELGDVVRVRFPTRGLHVFHPRHVKQALRSNVLNYPKSRFYEMLRPILGNGLFVSDGDLWTRQRQIMAPEFRTDAVRRFLPGMVENIEHLLERWERERSPAPRCISDDMMNLTLWIVGGAMFKSQFREEAEIIGRSLESCLAAGTAQMLSMGLLRSWMPTPGNVRAWRAERRLNEVVRDVVTRGRAGGPGKHDLLSRMIAAKDEHGHQAMDEQLVLDEVKSMILAGHETTSLTLSWTFYVLAQRPDIEERLYRESAAVLAKHGPTVDAIPELEYARRVFLETLRLYPPVPGVSREVRADDDFDGVPIRPGDVLFLSAYATHRHPACWERPDEYDPDRFAPERAEHIVPYSYMPFLLGRRACLGEHFGMLEGVIALAMIASRYRLERADARPIPTRPIATLRLGRPLMMRVVRR